MWAAVSALAGAAVGQDLTGVDAGGFDAMNSERSGGGVESGPPTAAPIRTSVQDEAQPVEDAISVDFASTFTNTYFFRGIIQEDDGFIWQPSLDVGVDLGSAGPVGLSFLVGTWSSVHGDTDTAGTDAGSPNWYEADFYVGPTFTLGQASLQLLYVWYESPSDAFNTIEELVVSLGWDDSERPLVPGVALSPYVTVAIETGDDAAMGPETGVYVEVGVAPGLTLVETGDGDVTLTVPLTVGLGFADYYDLSSGDQSAFGFFDIGVDVGAPLPLPARYGSWGVFGGVHLLTLGDTTSELNEGEDVEVVFSGGITGSF